MSVLACDREGCTNVMCDRLSDTYRAYICNDCFDELVHLGPGVNIRAFLDGEIPGTHNSIASRAYFEKIFEDRRQYP